MFHGMEFYAMLQTNSEEFNLDFLDPINLKVYVFMNMWVNNEVHMFHVRYDVSWDTVCPDRFHECCSWIPAKSVSG